ncbi:Hypothetical_protein [Hexamita inflata]|uniref:Hypothetical_protein n=1 Tax=Hexamita inflata TaxID=28002 RepID=A0AA86VUN2_9EUKA|nr:Hypothetical protein HINF_LOCUS66603 [Hexamita inflata]
MIQLIYAHQACMDKCGISNGSGEFHMVCESFDECPTHIRFKLHVQVNNGSQRLLYARYLTRYSQQQSKKIVFNCRDLIAQSQCIRDFTVDMYEILIEGIDSEFETVDKEVIEYNAARVAKPDYEQIRKQQQQQQQEQQQQIQAEKEAKKNTKAEKKEKHKKKLEAEKKGENDKQEAPKPEQKQNYIQTHIKKGIDAFNKLQKVYKVEILAVVGTVQYFLWVNA